MANVAQAPGPEEGQKEPFYMRMTPMELDIQLQTAELVFGSILRGERVHLSGHENIQSWEKDMLGPAWCEKNEKQREEILSQMNANGENTPAWMEAVGHMGDIAWEVLEAGDRGERIRSVESMDRVEIIEQFKDLKFKVEMSYYAVCGAGDRMFGFRACIALFRACIRDSELLKLMTTVLILCVRNNESNRDCLACLTVPPLPMEREKEFKDRGWSFLRNALDAFVVQAGGSGYNSKMEDSFVVLSGDNCSKKVSTLIAELLVNMKNAPAVLAQLKLVHEDPPADCWLERQELRDIIPIAEKTCEDLSAEMPSSATVLLKLRDMLAEGRAYVARLPAH